MNTTQAIDHVRSLIDNHFRMRITPKDERRMRVHLVECEACKTHYNNHLRVAEIDPGAPEAAERLAVGLGIRTRARQTQATVWYATSATAMAAAGVMAILALPAQSERAGNGDVLVQLEPAQVESARNAEDDLAARGLSARGADTDQAGLVVYRVMGDETVAIGEGDTIAANDELAFAYRNGEGEKHLLVFGIDGAGKVHWYFPAWQHAAENPTAIDIVQADEPTRLPDAIRHPLSGPTLEIVAVFTDTPVTVRDMESRIAHLGEAGATLPVDSAAGDPGATASEFVWSRVFRVQPK